MSNGIRSRTEGPGAKDAIFGTVFTLVAILSVAMGARVAAPVSCAIGVGLCISSVVLSRRAQITASRLALVGLAVNALIGVYIVADALLGA
ncbi:hypothetical protein [Nocardia sp. NPDC060249]|uniref:hypothetical protein n=1 Tax=Nocardia sp. NPDC060249 TaxID=3347082 RepID=UPI00364EB4FD